MKDENLSNAYDYSVKQFENLQYEEKKVIVYYGNITGILKKKNKI